MVIESVLPRLSSLFFDENKRGWPLLIFIKLLVTEFAVYKLQETKKNTKGISKITQSCLAIIVTAIVGHF
jgi:hypothetical protein